MQTWFYSKDGERQGPVSFDELRSLARRGELNGLTDMAWMEGLRDWVPSGTVSGLFTDETVAGTAGGAFNPYAAPLTASDDLLAQGDILPEIEPGSVPLDPVGCIQRAIELTKRHFGILLGIGVLMVVSSSVLGGILGFGYAIVGGGAGDWATLLTSQGAAPQTVGQWVGFIVMQALQQVIGIFFGLGLIRVALNAVSGERLEVVQLFSQLPLLWRAFWGKMFYFLIVAVGLVLLIVPGIYVSIRLSFYETAMVDRNLGVMESMRYSWRLTDKNSLSLLGLFVLMFLVVVAGALALLVGLIFAVPVITLAVPLAYRWLQFGRVAVEDLPGTQVPAVCGRTGPRGAGAGVL